MAVDRAPLLDRRFLDTLDALAAQGERPVLALDAPIRAGSRLTARQAIALFDAQVASRHVDYAARALRARNEGFYTIGSSGHEGNAAVAAALRPTDPGFLHYRSGAFFVARAHQVPGQTPLLDLLLSLCASSDEPIAGGRHKVFGSHALAIPPQTSTIASHPGIVIASPARGDDAAAMLRTCVAAARRCGSVCVFLEPIALYMTRDLHEPGDGLWTSAYEPDAAPVPIGAARTHGTGRDLLIVSFANGLWMSQRVARRLEREHGVACRVLDLRWLSPLPVDDLVREAEAVGRVLIVDETRRTGGVSEGVITALVDRGFAGPIARVAAVDSFIPLGAAANHVLVSEAEIERAALALIARRAGAAAAASATASATTGSVATSSAAFASSVVR